MQPNGPLNDNLAPSVSVAPNVAYQGTLILMTVIFFVFGFITCLNDILVPHLKSLFTLSYTQAALVQFCFFAAYFVMGLPAGKIVETVGFHRGTVVGLGIAALGCLMFYPAAEYASYAYFLSGLFVLASGITVIQVASNVYITMLGTQETASARLTFVQAFNSLGTTIAPSIGAYFILADEANGAVAQAQSVQGPYLVLAGCFVAVAMLLFFFKAPDIGRSIKADSVQHALRKEGEKASAWHYPHLVLGALGIFCYVGAEVAIGSYLINFIGLPQIMGLGHADAAHYVAFYWGGAMVGRFAGAALMAKIAPNKLLTFNALIAGALVLTALTLSGPVAMYAVLAVGLCNSIMFPTIYSLAVRDLGSHSAQGSAILNMAIVGGAVVPLVQGFAGDHLGLHHSFFLPVICYLYIAAYGLKFFRK